MKSLLIEEYNALVSYYDLGEGETVLVYLPGLNSPAMPLFADMVYHPLLSGYRSILIDYFGCGRSESPANFDHKMESHAKVVLEILAHENVTSCSIFGHSMGGTVGVYVAAMSPGLVTRLVLAESNLFPGGGVGTKWVTSFSEQDWIEKEHPGYIKNLREYAMKGDARSVLEYALWKDADPRGIYLSAQSIVTLPASFHMKFYNLTIPRYFLYGEQNFPKSPHEVTPDTPDPTQLRKYGVKPVIIPNSGHFMQVDNLKALITALHQCLS
jgi:pimeloyl-ACP methyl ester carboxylesterase